MTSQIQRPNPKSTMLLALPRSSSPPVPTARPSRRKLLWVAAVLALVATGAVARWQHQPDASPTAAEAPLRRVQVTLPEQAAGGELVLPATIQAYQAAELFARANGFLKAWHVDIGATVQAGQVLAEIEAPELDQELIQTAALLTQGQAEHEQAVAELEEARADVALAEANIVKATANLDYADSLAHRSSVLIKSQSIAREEYESSVRERAARQAEQTSAQAELARRKTNLSTRKAIIASRASVVANREANVQRLRDLTSFKQIVAPFAGIITRRHAEVGMLVTAGSNTGTRPLFSVAQIDILRLQAAVPQSSATGIRPGDLVTVTIPESQGRPLTARVARTAGAVDPASRSLLVEVELPNPEATILPGVYAQVRLQAAGTQARWVIQAKTLLMRSTGPEVVIVGSDNTLRTHKVTLGRDFGASVEVLVGLQGHEQLVVNPSEELRTGQAVQVAGRTDSRVQVAQK